ncbi:MAG: GAF domain-containing protein [Phycisphaerales bacterium]|nr:GAF domain-containing protein [Phycisphaerales bacterium]
MNQPTPEPSPTSMQPRSKDALQKALADAVTAVNADSGTIHLLGEDGVLHLQAASPGMPEVVLEKVRIVPVGKGMAGLAVERDRPVDACNIQTDTSGDVRPGAKATGLQGTIVVPIRRNGRAIGALGVGCRAVRAFTPEEIARLEVCADGIARSAD